MGPNPPEVSYRVIGSGINAGKIERIVTRTFGGQRVVTSAVPVSPDIESFRVSHPNTPVGDVPQRSLEDMIANASDEQLAALGLVRGEADDSPLSNLNNIQELRAFLKNIDDLQFLYELRQDEESGKDRISWVDAISARIDEITELREEADTDTEE